ncbi:gluconate 2-dehydrogenase subunit 3 family protein [Seonamhaeicola maritimus]|uniref:Gluconate 2-dehydrogenase subunit 3 family protein n=1 Tax=Seonamhaeicola maritimus TaxID=2591822 RepID=A0A5C7GJN7_9FLAO|nr:gluconate 2-dehydrogenase subunit 3 family protein [Seonamhaeicola maritimus]TXG38494.1 gluconate 2-dehydrogenase subunit 3 family protein [Seonamhaeicola maritimus]
MKRRDALKNIGLSLGYAAVAPSALSILQGCTTEAEKWVPQLLSIDEGIIVKNLVDLILPKTEASPGALEVNVPEFIDLLAFKSYNEEDKNKFIKGIKAIVLELTVDKDPEFQISKLTTEEYDAILAKYLKSKPEDRKDFNKEQKLTFGALAGLRGQSVWAYKTTEQIGENVLAYRPVPGSQNGCIDVNETTDGKAWSLQA